MIKNKSIDHCTFYNKYLIDDLLPYEIKQEDADLYIIYNNKQKKKIDCTRVIDKLKNYIEKTKSYSSENSLLNNDQWYPVFVQKDNNANLNKTLFRGFATTNDTFGIEEAITFLPQFNNWDVKESSEMTIDWTINSSISPYDTQYGILCWYQESEPSFSDKGIPYEQIPLGVIVRPKQALSYKINIDDDRTQTISIDENSHLLNIDNIRFQILDIKPQQFKNKFDQNDKDIFIFNNTINIFNISNYIENNYPKRDTESSDQYDIRIKDIKSKILFLVNGISKDVQSDDILTTNNKKSMIYISNGDVYSFYNDPIQKNTLLDEGISSSTYLSSSLFHIYREVWHSLTINNSKLDSAFLTRQQHRLLKKLCQHLSTFPLIDRVTVNILTHEDIQKAVKKFIDQSFKTIDLEIKGLFDIISIIAKKFTDLSVNIKHTNTDHTCYIRNKRQLFNKLISKYGAYLSIKKDDTLTYKSKLPYGPHVKINQDISSKAKKDAAKTILFNNFTANIGSFSIKSSISANRTYFSINNSDVPGQSTNIPLWDIQKKELLRASLEISAGPDLIIKYKDNDAKANREMIYPLIDSEIGDLDSQILAGEKLQIVWSKIYGPDCLRFSDSNLSLIRSEGGLGGANVPTLATPDFASTNITKPGVTGGGTVTPPVTSLYDSRYEESTDSSPNLFIRKCGKYILQLKVKASFGTVYDTATIYVVNDKGEYEPNKKPAPLKAATKVSLKPSNELTIFCPNIRQFAVGKQGIFWPINSDLSTYDTESNPYGTVASFGSQMKKYSIPMPVDKDGKKIISDEPVSLILKYEPNNTTITLRKIILTHMRDSNDDCYNCETFYSNILDNKGFVIDVNRDFTLTDIGSKDPINGQAARLSFSYPSEVSTKWSKVPAYGGYSAEQIDRLGVTIPNSLAPGKILPPIAGADMENDKFDNGTVTHLCHMKPVDAEKAISFEKGCFHPQSGWLFGTNTIKNPIYKPYINSSGTGADSLKNKTAVINFDPGHRSTFRFKGPGFFNLNNTSNDTNPNKQVYFSTISLGIDGVAQECYHPGEEFSDLIQCTDGDYENNEKQELSDLDPNHGYRNIGGDFSKLRIINSDETIPDIIVDPDGATPSNKYCNTASAQNYSASGSYTFTRRGAYLPLDKREPKSRFDRYISKAKIEDIEVQINFMNYVNTKNLIIWLDVVPCADVTRQLFPHYGTSSNSTFTQANLNKAADRWFYASKSAPDSIFSRRYKTTKQAIEEMEDSPLKKYLQALFAMNNNPKPEDTATGYAAPTEVTNTMTDGASTASMEGGTTKVEANGDDIPWSPTYRLYLLNQEHVEGNRYNFSIRFSDKAGRYASAHDHNYDKHIDPQQIKAIEKDGIIHLLPTISAFGYNDKDINFFQNIIRTNKLNTLNNTFAKFAGMELFIGDNGKAGFGSSIFTLGIAVMNESDNMEAIDSINNIDYINGIEKTIKSNRSNFLINNICSWELILTTDSPKKNFEPVDALGNISYLEPAISGYNFIANFKDQKYLLPPMNLNAPYDYLQDAGACKYSKEKLNTPVYSYTPLNILPIINVGGAISIFDAISLVSSVNDQMEELSRQIVDYFTNERRARQSQEYYNSLYVPKYNRYPMGESDKVLLSISKDNYLWYNLEASIFRYINSPILKSKKFKYLKLNYKTSKTLGIFPFNTVKYIESFFPDDNELKIISVPLNNSDMSFIKDIDTVTVPNLLQELQRLENDLKEITDILENTKDEKQRKNLQEKIDKLNILISLCDSTLNSIGNKLEKYDTIKIVKTVTVPEDKEKNQEEQGYNLSKNGIFIIDNIIDNKISLYEITSIGTISFIKILNKLREENLLDFKIEIIAETDTELAKTKPKKIKNNLIILDGLRPFYFFDKGDEILTFKPISQVINELKKVNNTKEITRIEKEIEDLINKISEAKKNNRSISEIKILEEKLWDKQNLQYTNKIKAKGYIHSGDSYKTIIELEQPIQGSSISKSPEQSNVALIYDNRFQTMDMNTSIMPFNKWSFVDTNNSKLLSDNVPETVDSMFGESSYGTGSVLVTPKILSNNQVKNRVPSFLDLVSYKRARSGTKMSGNFLTNESVENTSSDSTSSSSSSSESGGESSSSSSGATDKIFSGDVSGYNYTYNDAEYIKNIFNTIAINKDNQTNAEKRLKLESLFRDYPTYTQNDDDIGLLDIHIDAFKRPDIPDDGYIELDRALEIEEATYKFTISESRQIQNRLNLLNKSSTLISELNSQCKDSKDYNTCINNFWNGLNINTLYILDLYLYIQNIEYLSEDTRIEKQALATNRLQSLIIELRTIEHYCEIGGITIVRSVANNTNSSSSSGGNTQNTYIVCKAYDGPKVLPTNKIEIRVSDTGALSFIESLNYDDYWINIDPEQSIGLDYSNTTKILISTEYVCKIVNDTYSSNVSNICPSITTQLDPITSTDPDMTFERSGNSIKYITSRSKIREQAAKYKDIEWNIPNDGEAFDSKTIYSVERNFFLNGLSQERNQLVTVIETYIIPTVKFSDQVPISAKDNESSNYADGYVKNKVGHIFDLTNTNQLKVRFKRIPRKWKGIDTYYDVYKPNYLGELPARSIIPSPGGPIDHTLKFWQCISSKTGKYIDPPLYFKWLNEMIFRAYYGSVDAAEHCGRSTCESREISEWIPYDYL